MATFDPDRPREAYPLNEQIAMTNFWAWNDHDYELGARYLADGWECIEMANGRSYKGKEGLLDEYRMWHTAMSDGRCVVKSIVSDGDVVVVESTAEGHNDGPLRLPEGEFPPSNKPMSFAMCTVFEISDGREIVRRHYFDLQGLLDQVR